ncbi:MAG: hypothetical protein AMXMBFR7_20290 [Planctomycetota bacterium]
MTPTEARRSGGTAALLEVLPGLFLNLFGMGHIYAGRVGVGLLVMFGYWVLLTINILLCFVIVGFVTLPMTWLGFMIFSPLAAAKACEGR